MTHTPVLLHEAVTSLAPRPGGRWIDATVGLGGHACALLEASEPSGRLLGIDVDPAALARAGERLRHFGDRAIVVRGNARNIYALALEHDFLEADGVLFDLGVSSLQLSEAGRGFSFQHNAPLDMRMDPTLATTAADLLNELSESALTQLLHDFGEEPHARQIARAVVRRRPLTTTFELAQLVHSALGRAGGRVNPATRTFQALRIAVNGELSSLSEALNASLRVLRAGGRLAVITFHSLEDRIVKRFLYEESRDCICPPSVPICVCSHRARLSLLHRGGLTPSAAEIARNPRSRSARLRLAERL